MAEAQILIVEDENGVYSEAVPGHGSVFVFTLPGADKQVSDIK
jgi:hypothetical protein